MPYSFICCRPQPSLNRRGIHFFLHPVRLGVWNMRISTLSEPCLAINDARREAHDGSGVSRVPLNASVRTDNVSLGLLLRARSNVSMKSYSLFPMYSVDRYMRFRALRILLYYQTFQLANIVTSNFHLLCLSPSTCYKTQPENPKPQPAKPISQTAELSDQAPRQHHPTAKPSTSPPSNREQD